MTHEDLAFLVRWMADEGYDAEEIVYAVAKPWKHEDLLTEARGAEVVPASLTEFLLARIAEDEAVARRAVPISRSNSHALGVADEGAVTATPARVLAECKALRQIIESLADEDCFMATLATIYADHPDYDESWRSITPQT